MKVTGKSYRGGRLVGLRLEAEGEADYGYLEQVVKQHSPVEQTGPEEDTDSLFCGTPDNPVDTENSTSE